MRHFLVFGLAGGLLCGQEPSVEQEAEGPCSVVIQGNNNHVFTCQGIDEKLGNQILEIVNRVADHQLDPEIVMAKLDEILRYQERHPELMTMCSPPADGDPSIIECKVQNSGSAEARDVLVAFNRMLPLDTEVIASPELGMTVREANLLPHPHQTPDAALKRAFSVHVPRITPGDSVSFQVRTTNVDNRRAAAQFLYMRRYSEQAIEKFTRQLANRHPEALQRWSIQQELSMLVKRQSFFLPGQTAYEQGREPVVFFTKEEQAVIESHQGVARDFRALAGNVMVSLPKLLMPVVRIKTSQGPSESAIQPPWARTCMLSKTHFEFDAATGAFNGPRVPAVYDFEKHPNEAYIPCPQD